MADQPLSHSQEAADLARAPAGAPATATIVPDTRLAGEDGEPESPPPPDRPEIEPGQAPENDPDLQPIIPPVENPTF